MNDDPSKETPIAELDRDNVVNHEPKPPPQNGNGQEPETISDRVVKAREAIPVGERGIAPTRFEDQVVHAKALVKAHVMLPEHLHDNVAVMVALVGIAARFNLDPAMLATQTYVQNGRLCFQAQAFGAILYASGLLIGRLRYEYRGEGENMTCTISGRFKDDPDFIYSATSPTVKEVHPGYSTKEGKQHMVKGSPLWDKDVEQQLGYFAQRRWIRRYAPDCVLGMYTREELSDLDTYRAGRGESVPLTADRLGQLDTGEGWQEGAHVDLDLAALKPAEPDDEDWEREKEKLHKAVEENTPGPEPARAARRKPVRGRKPAGRVQARPAQKKRPGAAPRGRAPTRAVVQAAVKRAEQGPPRRAPIRAMGWLDYVQRSEKWINAIAGEPDKAMVRWDNELEERDRLKVPMGERSRLRAILDRKVTMLTPKKKDEDDA